MLIKNKTGLMLTMIAVAVLVASCQNTGANDDNGLNGKVASYDSNNHQATHDSDYYNPKNRESNSK